MTTDQQETSAPGDLGDLARRLAGPVLTPADAGYADELAGFDLSVPQHSALVVGVTGAADTAAEDALLADLAPWGGGGALVNFLAGPRVTPADVAAAYEPERWARLVETKTRWDPDNVFRSNHNVPPRGGLE